MPNGMNADVTAACVGPGQFGGGAVPLIGVIREKLKTLICVGTPGPGAVTMLWRPDAKSTKPEATLTPEHTKKNRTRRIRSHQECARRTPTQPVVHKPRNAGPITGTSKAMRKSPCLERVRGQLQVRRELSRLRRSANVVQAGGAVLTPLPGCTRW